MAKTGLLLINLGTPDHADTKAVYRYLKQFLNDPRVIDLPGLLRWVLTNLLIVPFRTRKSTAAYAKIWTTAGSPLLVNSIKLKNALACQLGAQYQVELAMRYGQPNIPSAIARLKNCTQIIVLPLFPQYSSAATGSAIENLLTTVRKSWNIPTLQIHKDFYEHPGFIAAYADLIATHTAAKHVDQFIFSYHGLPERHIDKSHCAALCNKIDACPEITEHNAYCYRAQCYQTSTQLAQTLKLTPNQYTVAFQSRLGRTPWIKPYVDVLLPELRSKGIKNIAVVCPSFVADCLETLEEVDIRLRQQWLALGGETFIFVPCLNDHPMWVKALGEIVHQSTFCYHALNHTVRDQPCT